MRRLIVTAMLILSSTTVFAAEEDNRFRCDRRDNADLCRLYRADQEARQVRPLDLTKLDDPAAIAAARAIISRGQVRTGNDYFKVSTLLLHSSRAEDYLLAHILATEGMAADPKHERVRLLAALSLDRYLLAVDQPQVFGTQLLGGGPDLVFRGEVDCQLIDRRRRESFLGEYPEPCRARGDNKVAGRGPGVGQTAEVGDELARR